MKKNVASQVIGAQLCNASGVAYTSTVTAYVTGDNGTQTIGSTGSGLCTIKGNGYHSYVPTQAETNYDHIAFTFTGVSAIPVTVQVYTTWPLTSDLSSQHAATDTVVDNIYSLLAVTDAVVDNIYSFQAVTDAVVDNIYSLQAVTNTKVDDVYSALAVTDGVIDNNYSLLGVVSGNVLAAYSAISVTGVTADNIYSALAVTDAVVDNSYSLLGVVSSNVTLILDDTASAIPATLATILDDTASAIPASIAALPTAVENADALLGRNIAGGSDGGRDVTSALQPLRNKWIISGGTLTVYGEDDLSVAWTASVTTAAGDPLDSIDPA